MDQGVTFFCFGPSDGADIEMIDDPTKYLHNVVSSLPTKNEEPQAAATIPNAIACFRIKFRDSSLVSKIRGLEDTLDQRETEIAALREKVLHLHDETTRHKEEVWDLTSTVNELRAEQKSATSRQTELETLLSKKEEELGNTKIDKSRVKGVTKTVQQEIKTGNPRDRGDINRSPNPQSGIRKDPTSRDDILENLSELERLCHQLKRVNTKAILLNQGGPTNEAASNKELLSSLAETQSTGSPTDLNIPNRKILDRRIHVAEFLAEISTTLIERVRRLRAEFTEDNELTDSKAENAPTEYQAKDVQQEQQPPPVDKTQLTNSKLNDEHAAPIKDNNVKPDTIKHPESTSDKGSGSAPDNSELQRVILECEMLKSSLYQSQFTISNLHSNMDSHREAIRERLLELDNTMDTFVDTHDPDDPIPSLLFLKEQITDAISNLENMY
ncbi:hypothetical protein F4859DRAFT_516146 [Xylaria cf. heliscus]|nr:hypothetical protein F4859DRAFT_516146 [Xylaria cf. heliscus]